MNGLVRKELRELRPFLLLGCFLLALDLFEWLTGQPDMRPLSISLVTDIDALAYLLFLLGFALGSGLLVREIDDRTLSFLDGLPVARLQVFAVKVVVAFGVLLIYPAGGLLMAVAQHVLSRQSLDHAMHAPLLWQSAGMIVLLTGVSLGLGLLLGFLRNLCWLTLGVLALIVVSITQVLPPFAVFNPVKLLDMQLVGASWHVPSATLITQAGILVITLGLAAILFVPASGSSGRRMQLTLSRPLVSAFVTVATIAVALAGILFIGATADEPEGETVAGGHKAQFAESPVVSARSERYSFSYHSQQADQAQALLREADRIHAEVAAILGAAPGAPIDVDLTGSLQNTEGSAFHDRIRMHLGRRPQLVLAHETAHVLAHRLAGGELQRELSKMSALNEGIATWVHNLLTSGRGLTDAERFQAAIVSQRHLVTPAQLTDMAALARQADIGLRYPLGAAVVDALVSRYGRDAPGKLLRVLGDADFPRGLESMELWYAAFQAAKFDLALVFDDYSRRAKQWEAEFAARIAALPRPRGSLLYREDMIGVELRWEGELPEGWRPVVRYRPEQDSTMDQYILRSVNDEAVAWMPDFAAVADQLCFQPGLRTEDGLIFEAWVCLPVDPGRR